MPNRAKDQSRTRTGEFAVEHHQRGQLTIDSQIDADELLDQARYESMTSDSNERLAILAEHPDVTVRRHVAANEYANATICGLLAKDANQSVVVEIADRRFLVVDIQQELIQHPDPVVRAHLVFNVDTVSDIREAALSDPEPMVRLSLLMSKRVSLKEIETLARDDDIIVRTAAQSLAKRFGRVVRRS